MPTGSCLCGGVKIAYTGEPAFQAICYCYDCRKFSNGHVFQVPAANFSVTEGESKLKVFTKTSDHNNPISNHFCTDCGTTLYRTGGSEFSVGRVGLRVGVLDDQEIMANKSPPSLEVYVDRRPIWVSPVEGARRLDAKYQPVG